MALVKQRNLEIIKCDGQLDGRLDRESLTIKIFYFFLVWSLIKLKVPRTAIVIVSSIHEDVRHSFITHYASHET